MKKQKVINTLKTQDQKDKKKKALIGLGVLFILTGAAMGNLICERFQGVSEAELAELSPENLQDERMEKIKSLLKLLELDENDIESHLEIGKLYNDIQNYKKANYHLNKADLLSAKEKVNNQVKYDILTELAHALSKQNKFDAAIKALERAKKIDPKRTRAYNKKGNIHDKKKEYKKARKEYVSAKKVDKKDPEAYKNLAEQALRKNQPKDALRELKDAVRNNPKSYKAFENLGDGYRKLKKYNKAISTYKRALELHPPP